MRQTNQAGGGKTDGAALSFILFVSGALSMGYALAVGMSRSADALQGFGLLLVSAAALFITSPKLQSNLVESGRGSVPAILLALGGLALWAGTVMSWL